LPYARSPALGLVLLTRDELQGVIAHDRRYEESVRRAREEAKDREQLE
jgi:hypothetical protein